MYKQLYQHFETMLSSIQCGFRKVHIAQHYLLVMIEKLEKQLIMVMHSVTVISKAFDCIDHSLLFATLCGYWVSHTLLKLVFSYSENRTQRTKVNNCFSKSSKSDFGVNTIISKFHSTSDNGIDTISKFHSTSDCGVDTIISKFHFTSDCGIGWLQGRLSLSSFRGR